MDKQQEEWKERFRHYFIEMHPINGHDMHNRPLLYDAEFEKIELLVEFIQHEIQLARKEVKEEVLDDEEENKKLPFDKTDIIIETLDHLAKKNNWKV